MKRKLFNLLLSLGILFSLALTVSAEGLPRVADQAGLLTEEEEAYLTEKAASLGDSYQMDIILVTTDSLDGKTPERYADDFFDENGYGYGEDYSGILFLLSTEERDWYISTCGSSIYALTDYGIQETASAALPYFGDGSFYQGFDLFLDALVPYLEAWQLGDPIDGQADYGDSGYAGTQEVRAVYKKAPSLFPLLLPCLSLGLAAAGATVGIMAATMNTKRRQNAAGAYLKDGSFHISRHQDLFLYSRVTKTRRESSSSGSHGGSSIHHSSGGRSHGGGGGKF